MAVTDAYATAAEYRAAVLKDSTAEDAVVLIDLTSVTRYIERKLGQFFTQDANVVARLYEGSGTRRLRLDTHGNIPGIATLTGLVVKVDLNGDYDVSDSGETITIDTHFWAGPQDADKGAEPWPWTHLDIMPTNTVLSAWPARERAVEVTAKYGWPAVPAAVKRACIELTAILRLETPRAKAVVSESGEILEASREARGIVDKLLNVYGGGIAL